jgi:hypothetical protein
LKDSGFQVFALLPTYKLFPSASIFWLTPDP